MDTNILNSTKKMLGLIADDTSFNSDIMMYLNSAFSSLNQLIGSTIAPIEEDTQWDHLNLDPDALSLVKVYVYLKVRLLFDPPTMSFLIEAVEKLTKEQEWRLVAFHDDTAATTYPPKIEEEVV